MSQSVHYTKLTKYSSRFPTLSKPSPSPLPQLSPTKLPTQPALRVPKSALSTAANSYNSLISKPVRGLPGGESKLPALPMLRPVEAVFGEFGVGMEGAEGRFKRGIEERSGGSYEAAASIFQEIIGQFPEHVGSRLNLGVCLMSLGRLSEASDIHRQGLVLAPDPRLYFNQAICLILNNDLLEASEMLDLASQFPLEPLSKSIFELQTYIASALSSSPKPRSSISPLLRGNIDESPLEDVCDQHGPGSDIDSKLSTEKRAVSLSPVSQSVATFIVPTVERRSQLPRKHSFWKVFKSIHEFDHTEQNLPRGRRFSPLLVRMRTKSASRPSLAVGSYPIPLPKKPTIAPYLTEEDETPKLKVSSQSKDEHKRRLPLQKIRKTGSFLQEDLEDEHRLRQLQFDAEQEDVMQQKFSEVRTMVQKEADKLALTHALIGDIDLEKTVNGRLTQHALDAVREIFAIPLTESSEKRLLGILSSLKFFARFQKEVRLRLLNISKHVFFRPGETIFRQGETGSLMYVILSGSVVVRKEVQELGETPLTISTLYDGDSFGELSLFLTQGERGDTARPVTCVAGEPCDLLAIPKLSFHNIIMGQVETAIETKLSFLSSLSLFEGVERVNLVPLASNIEPVSYKFNETIVAQGERPKGMFIVFSGLCKVYTEGYAVKRHYKEEFASARIRRSPSVKPFAMGMAEYNKVKQRDWVPYPDKPVKRSKSVRYFRARREEQETQIPEKVLQATLQGGDFFAGRCLLAHEDGNQDASIDPAKCSVIAESSEVSLFLLTKKHLKFMGEKLSVKHRQETMKSKLASAVEFDCPKHITGQDLKDEYTKWSNYKQKLVDKAYRNWFVQRNAHRLTSALRDNA